MKNLIVCCDGTWNDPNNADEDVPSPTNVRKLFEAIDLNSYQPIQLSRYQSGVGTGGALDRIAGGLIGFGLSEDIRDCYQWLSDKYEQGDKIFLFGFSRGAFTARSLAGMIGQQGLVDFTKHGDESRQALVKKVYQQGYRNGTTIKEIHFHPNSTAVHFVGVWDTVGALGIPDDKVVLDLLDRPKNYEFHDTALGRHIRHARHAVALDERRGSFTPTLWTKTPAGSDVKQLWFPGVHSDVGGGYKETGLSDGALKWMIDEATAVTDGIQFHEKMVTQISPNARDLLHDSYTGVMKILLSAPRGIPNLDDPNSPLHPSVRERRDLPPINQGLYYPTRHWVDNRIDVDIYARHRWYWTGVYLEKGIRYHLTASGEWVDGTVPASPDGADDGDFHIGEVAHLAGNLVGAFERGWKYLTKKEMAEFWGTKRVENADWLALIGAVAYIANPQTDGTLQPLDIIVIGKDKTFTAKHSGYLYCFANDAWNFYQNNRGYVSLTLTKE